jgi:lysophospholipase L1-like esterase
MTVEDPFAAIARHLTERRGVRRRGAVSCYAALGDSFTAGTGCAPAERWPDRLAAALRRRHGNLAYRNLAEHGATSEDVLAQVGPALQLEPDLVTVICGANDVLQSVRPDVEGYARRLAEILDRLRSALPGVAILTATAPESWSFLELGPRTEARVRSGIARINAATRSVAARRAVPCLEVSDHPGLDDASNFAADGLHPSADGHRYAAVEIAQACRDHFGIESELTWRNER